jgi:hypothetical protein
MAIFLTLRKIIATVLAILSLGSATILGTPTNELDLQYVVDRIEIGAEGEQWVVLEVYDKNSDTAEYINIKVEEGYKVVDNY